MPPVPFPVIRFRRAASRHRLRAGAVRLAALGAVVAVGACDQFIPTEVPNWTTRWVVPTDSTTIGVSNLLPSSGTVRVAGNAFEVSFQPVTESRTLGQLAPQTQGFSGQFVPIKPAFEASIDASVNLPTDISSATITGGTVAVVMTNDFSFDPLRPNGNTEPFGSLAIRVTSGNTLLASDSIDGRTTPFSRNTTLSRSLNLASTTIAGPVQISVRIRSPQGGPTTVNANDRFTVQVTPQNIRASQAQVRVQNQSISAQNVEFNLSDIDEAIRNRIQGGAILLTVANPFQVGGNLNIGITGGGTPINKQVQLTAGSTSATVQEIVLSKEELRSILGRQSIRLSAAGTVNAPSGAVTVTPSQTIVFRTRLRLDINISADQ